jgi:predicted nucleic acid-binding Zn ribbon protein
MIARHTRRIRIENKILKIEVDNAPLREQLNLSKTRILKLVNEKAGRQLVIECLIF